MQMGGDVAGGYLEPEQLSGMVPDIRGTGSHVASWEPVGLLELSSQGSVSGEVELVEEHRESRPEQEAR